MKTARSPLWLVAGALLFACVAEVNQRVAVTSPPSGATFEPVADYLVHRCGSLDCHGQVGRNFKIYGGDGLRLDPRAVSGDVGHPTTDAEYSATWTSLVALEPESMSLVVAEAASRPERLTFVRKAIGTEQHAGGTLVSPDMGDRQYACIVSWLAGAVDHDACIQARDPEVYP